MSTKILTTTLHGIDAFPVEIEADIAPGLPTFTIVGLPDASVRESRDRVKSAMKNSGLPFPMTRLTVNLAPAELRKIGTGFDLPIALAILLHLGVFDVRAIEHVLCVGELGLDGELRPVRGALASSLAAKAHGITSMLLPSQNAAEAALVPEVTVYGFRTLSELVSHLEGSLRADPSPRTVPEPSKASPFDFADIAGLGSVKRAMEVAAAGAHNILLSGPPGAGKTLISRSVPSILPEMSWDEVLETTRIHAIAGTLPNGCPVMSARPWSAPHHTASPASVIGGGTDPRPGAVTLAHRGILFLDEFPEFPRGVLESLRQPLEDRQVTVSRASGSATFPADFMLVAAQNPCPCGHYGEPERTCTCSPMAIANYTRRISGPILDRIDLRIDIPRMNYADLASAGSAEPSSEVRNRVEAARRMQMTRGRPHGVSTNAAIPGRLLGALCPLDEACEAILSEATERFRLSARSAHRVIRVARTIADLSGEERIALTHLSEALRYRIARE